MSTRQLDGAIEVHEVEAFFDDLAKLAAAALSTPDHDVVCGITVERGDAQVTVASSAARASELDEIQYEVDRGPCLHPLRSGQIVRFDDLETSDDWPMWRTRALRCGRSVVVVGAGSVQHAAGGWRSRVQLLRRCPARISRRRDRARGSSSSRPCTA